MPAAWADDDDAEAWSCCCWWGGAFWLAPGWVCWLEASMLAMGKISWHERLQRRVPQGLGKPQPQQEGASRKARGAGRVDGTGRRDGVGRKEGAGEAGWTWRSEVGRR